MTRFRQTRYPTFPLHMDAARLRAMFILFLIAVMVAGCGSPRKSGGSGSATRGGGYYLDDGPGDDIPPGIENIPDAVPRIEPHNAANFRPYKVMGQRFVPISATTLCASVAWRRGMARSFMGRRLPTAKPTTCTQ